MSDFSDNVQRVFVEYEVDQNPEAGSPDYEEL